VFARARDRRRKKEDFSEEEQPEKKGKWFGWSPNDTTKGAVIGAVATITASVGLWLVKEMRDVWVARNSLRAKLQHAHTMTLEARDAHLNHAEPKRVRQLLDAAEATAKQMETLVEAQPIVCNAMLAFWGYDANVLRHLRSHIEYHLAKVELRSGNAEGISKASARLGAADNLRAGLDDVEPERARLSIKLGDMASQQRAVSHAKWLYEEHADDPNNLLAEPPSFWKVRACNNLAVLHFGLAEDQDASNRTRQVIKHTGDWVRRVQPHATLELVNAALALKEGKGEEGWPPSGELNRLLQAVALDAVDTLHLPHMGSFWLPPNLQAVRYAHIERLERITLMLRKHCTSRANALLLVCAPYSTALSEASGSASTGAAEAAHPATKLIALLTDAVRTAPAADLYFELDAPWIAEEGASRMFAAVGWGLTELVASGAIRDAKLRDRVHAQAEELLTAALQPFGRVSSRLPSTHLCVATLAMSRFEEVCKGNPQAALDRLSTPAARAPLGASVLQWSTQAQLKARTAVQAQVAAGDMHPTSNVPPRNSRWQLSVLLRAIGLKLQLGLRGEITHGEWDALEFASKSCMPEPAAAVSGATAPVPAQPGVAASSPSATIAAAAVPVAVSAAAVHSANPPSAVAALDASPLSPALQRLLNARTLRWYNSWRWWWPQKWFPLLWEPQPSIIAAASTRAAAVAGAAAPTNAAAAAPKAVTAAAAATGVAGATAGTAAAAGTGAPRPIDAEVETLLKALDAWKADWRHAALRPPRATAKGAAGPASSTPQPRPYTVLDPFDMPLWAADLLNEPPGPAADTPLPATSLLCV